MIPGLVSLHELPGYSDAAPKGWESWRLGKVLGHVPRQGWIEPDVLDDVAALSERRKPCGHRVVDRLISDDEPEQLTVRLLAEDARLAATTALRVYFGNYFREPFAPARANGPRK